jgi:uncharacterized surface protein with fasciclin (FAS1) repeats
MKKQLLSLLNCTSALRIGLIVAFSAFAVSCNKSDEVSPGNLADASQKNIVEVLETYDQAAKGGQDQSGLKSGKAAQAKKPTFSTLSVALARTGLAGTVASNRLTVFAPTDEAFAALGLYPNNIASLPGLKEILLYHVVAGTVYSFQLSGGFVPTLNGAAVEIKLNPVMVNDATVESADIKARNGVIHAIDKVLMPPTKNLVELALSFNPEFSILVAAVGIAELGETLATGGPFTVFAPTNDAFLAFFEANGIDPANLTKADVTPILLHHVVPGRVYSSDLVNGLVATLNGNVTVNVNNSNVNNSTITDGQGIAAGFIEGLLNVQATNGVVHVINKVLLP